MKPFTKEQREAFEIACKQLIDWRKKNLCPHDVIVIDSTHAEVLIGMMSFPFGYGVPTDLKAKLDSIEPDKEAE